MEKMEIQVSSTFFLQWQMCISQTEQCDGLIQFRPCTHLTHFTPNICYYDSDRDDCMD